MAIDLYLENINVDEFTNPGESISNKSNDNCCDTLTNLTITNDLSVFGTLWAYTLTHVNETVIDYSTNQLTVTYNASIGGNLYVDGDSYLDGDLQLLGDINIYGNFRQDAHFEQDVSIDGSLYIGGVLFDPDDLNFDDVYDYIDSSLLVRDSSITNLTYKVNTYNQIQDVSILDLYTKVDENGGYDDIQDVSILRNESSINWLYENGLNNNYDAIQDVSILDLYTKVNESGNYDDIQDVSIFDIYDKLNEAGDYDIVQDSSIVNLRNDYYNLQTDISVNQTNIFNNWYDISILKEDVSTLDASIDYLYDHPQPIYMGDIMDVHAEKPVLQSGNLLVTRYDETLGATYWTELTSLQAFYGLSIAPTTIYVGDISINHNLRLDGSFYYQGTEIDFSNLPNFSYIDGSLATRDASIERIDSSLDDIYDDVSILKDYVDGSLATRDASIIELDSSVDWLFDNKVKILDDLDDVSLYRYTNEGDRPADYSLLQYREPSSNLIQDQWNAWVDVEPMDIYNGFSVHSIVVDNYIQIQSQGIYIKDSPYFNNIGDWNIMKDPSHNLLFRQFNGTSYITIFKIDSSI